MTVCTVFVQVIISGKMELQASYFECLYLILCVWGIRLCVRIYINVCEWRGGGGCLSTY